MTCQHMMTLGVYLLGALDPTERSAFESHLSYCEICRGELIRLAPLPGLLNQVAPEDFADNLPPTGLEGVAVATQVQPITEPVPLPVPPPPPVREDDVTPSPANPAPRRYWRVAAAAAAVVVLAVGGIFGWSAMREESVPPAAGVTWSASEGATSVDARLVDHEWGTEIQSKIHGLPPGKKCYLIVYDHYGKKEIAGWWGTDHDPNEEIPGATSTMRSKIDRIEYLVEDKDGSNQTVAFTIEAPS